MTTASQRQDLGYDPISALLARLDGVRETAPNRWIARCPAHEDRTPSLRIAAGEDGRALIKDHGGCESLDIVHAVGLEFADLFPAHTRREHRPRILRRATIAATDLLAIIDHEALVVAIIAADILERRTIDEATWTLLGRAVHRIRRARDHAAPALLAIVAREALVIVIIAEGMLENRAIAPEVWERLAQAVVRIGRARDHAAPARVRRSRS